MQKRKLLVQRISPQLHSNSDMTQDTIKTLHTNNNNNKIILKLTSTKDIHHLMWTTHKLTHNIFTIRYSIDVNQITPSYMQLVHSYLSIISAERPNHLKAVTRHCYYSLLCRDQHFFMISCCVKRAGATFCTTKEQSRKQCTTENRLVSKKPELSCQINQQWEKKPITLQKRERKWQEI